MYSPKLSVIVPIYNNEATIKRCINSILKQSFRNLELVLVDDGSSDSSLNICREFMKVDSRVKVFTQNRLGVSAARNRGIKESSGKYICFSDGDDEYLSNSFKAVVDSMVEENIDMFVGSVREKKNGVIRDLKPFPGRNNCQRMYMGKKLDLLRRWTMDRNSRFSVDECLFDGFRMGSPWAKFIKRTSIQGISFDTNLGISEDLLFVYQVLSKMGKVLISNDVLYVYHINETSVTQNKYNPNIIKYNLALANKLIEVKKDYDHLFEQSMYKKMIICYWDSVVKGISNELSVKEGIKEVRLLSINRIYKICFKNFKIGDYMSSKESLITLLFRLHFYGAIFFIGHFFSRRK